MTVDLSLYLVTDSRPQILGDRSLGEVVSQALQGGVTVVQYREKHSDTGVMIETAKRLHTLTKAHNVPLIINDRVDVALAVGAEGVHIGQDDMSVATARKLLPENTIIGATVSSVEEAKRAIAEGASYLGIGTVFSTSTKTNTKSIIGPAGVRKILDYISTLDADVQTVAIGGITIDNVQRVIYQSQAPTKGLQGIAVVSAIMGAKDPKKAAEEFRKRISVLPTFATHPAQPRPNEVAALLNAVPDIVAKVATQHPLCHCMINFVVPNFTANALLSIGASPIMSGHGEEAADLAKNGGALLINMGTLGGNSMQNYLQAVKAYNEQGNPVVFDPVGAGATHVRRDATKQLMAGGYFDLIKGNESELKQVYGAAPGKQVGVDSGPSTLSSREKAAMVKAIARRERNIVLMTGSTDYLSDGERTFAIGNGHEFLGHVTGTGCTVGAIAAAFLAVHRADKLLAVLSGILLFELAAENAAKKENVHGPGSFVPALLDELWALKERSLAASGKGDSVVKGAKVQLITDI
ncbi:hypothetical protein VTO42DRAFT_6225 [Malbranchea cinnamomea]